MKMKQQDRFRALARRRWPKAALYGDGKWASVSHCGDDPTAYLFDTVEKAVAAKLQIDQTGCCGGCEGMHQVLSLTDPVED